MVEVVERGVRRSEDPGGLSGAGRCGPSEGGRWFARGSGGRGATGRRERADAEQLAEVVGEAGQQVLAGGERESAEAEGGEAAGVLELTEDRLDDGLAAGVASASLRLAELEAHRAGEAGALSVELASLLARLQAAGAERAVRAVGDGRDVAVVAGAAWCARDGRWAAQAVRSRADPDGARGVVADAVNRGHLICRAATAGWPSAGQATGSSRPAAITRSSPAPSSAAFSP